MSTNNLAAILYKKNDIRLEQRLPGEPGDEEVLIRIDSVGICGSDVHQWTHGGIGHKMVKEPMVMGHEAAGVVER
jgi:threonine dehydrogenase-like Zn-dependent dehydrogenase